MNESENDLLTKIKFNGSRREYYRNTQELPIETNDTLIVEADRGEDIGNALPCFKEKRCSAEQKEAFCVIRKASEADIIENNENRIKEKLAFQFCERKVSELKLPMVLIDVEYRFDRKKVIFYFTAEGRIDFRELVKILAAEYKTRIEMKQISAREEIKRFGGIGPCGIPICCKEFLDEFEPISTQFVKDQNLPMNPSKISGNCGKLKCCYRYEHETYSEFLKNYPPYGTPVKCDDKIGTIEKIDIFQNTVALKFEDDTIEEFPLADFKTKIKVA